MSARLMAATIAPIIVNQFLVEGGSFIVSSVFSKITKIQQKSKIEVDFYQEKFVAEPSPDAIFKDRGNVFLKLLI